ncbi:MAG: glycoside hydrolase family 88 protein [Flavobacterium sp.]|nr:glycoside hydrolase family 88 protein [Flavobacterium sp.]
MKKFNSLFFIILFTIFNFNCHAQYNPASSVKKEITSRFSNLLDFPIDSVSIPRSMVLATGVVKKVQSKDWTSGFYAGNLWQIYKLTGDVRYKEKATLWNAFIEKEKFNSSTHDMGFKVYCSYGKGLKVEDNIKYKNIIVKSAQTLVTRFNNKIGAIRSWDHNKESWDFPVIIDNMLNLELLFEASKISGDKTYRNIAIQHANTTLKNHFRKDNSCYHVVDYDTITGKVRSRGTHQGFNNESSWARGQSWAVYGFTMAYRYTKNKEYLKQAEATAKYYINYKNLPQDGIPYWDFNDTSIPNAPRDASSAAVMASALIELYTFTKNQAYLDYSNKVINTLSSDKYLLNDAVKGPFILDHSTGNWPKKDEIDQPIVYADYYFLEAIIRKQSL